MITIIDWREVAHNQLTYMISTDYAQTNKQLEITLHIHECFTKCLRVDTSNMDARLLSNPFPVMFATYKHLT